MAVCNTLLQVAFNCAGVTATNTSNIGVCISDLGGESCASLFDSTGAFNEPGSCMTAFENVPLSNAQDKCVTLVEEVCDPADACLGQQVANTADVAACVTEGVSTDQGLGCQFATGVSSTIDQCISDLCVPPDGGTPDGGAALPASCDNPVSYPPGTTM